MRTLILLTACLISSATLADTMQCKLTSANGAVTRYVISGLDQKNDTAVLAVIGGGKSDMSVQYFDGSILLSRVGENTSLFRINRSRNDDFSYQAVQYIQTRAFGDILSSEAKGVCGAPE